MSNHPATPTVRDYDAGYFTTLYGTIPQQTPVDKGRDWLIHRLVTRHLKSGRLVEMGCGFGYLLGRFDAAWQLHGTDLSPHAAAIAQQRLPHARIAAADIQAGVPFQGQFDVLIAVNVIEHLPQPSAAAAGIAQAVRPGGLVVVHLPTISSRLAGWVYARSYERDPTHVYRPSGNAVNRLFEQAGFRTLHSLYCPFWPASLWRWLKPHPAYLAVYQRL